MLFKYRVTFIVLFVGMALIHSSLQNKYPLVANKENPLVFYCNKFSPMCRSVYMTLDIVNVPYTYIELDVLKRDHLRNDDFKKVNPMHQVPAIFDPTNGKRLWESRAIIKYLITVYGNESIREKWYPNDYEEQTQIDQMLYFDSNELSDAVTELYSQWAFFKIPKTEYKVQRLLNALKIFDDLLGKELETDDKKFKINADDVALVSTILAIKAIDAKILNKYKHINNWTTIVKVSISESQSIELKKYIEEAEKFIKDTVEQRNNEDSKNLMDDEPLISNKDVINATKLLKRAVDYKVIYRTHRDELEEILKIMDDINANQESKSEDKGSDLDD